MKRIRRSPAARADFNNIWLHIALDNPDAATRMVERIADATGRLAEYPLSAPAQPELGEGIRCLTVGMYRIFHRIEEDHVLILRVVHAARNIGALFTEE